MLLLSWTERVINADVLVLSQIQKHNSSILVTFSDAKAHKGKMGWLIAKELEEDRATWTDTYNVWMRLKNSDLVRMAQQRQEW